MSKKKEFGEGYVFTISNYIMWFFLGSFYFLLLNIPLILTLMVIGSAKPGSEELSGSFLMLLISSIPLGPALTALMSVMGRIIRTQGTSLTKDFFKAYKTNFIQSLMIWVVESIIFLILYIDIKYFSIKLPVSKYFFYFIGTLVFIIGLYVYPIISRFYMKTRNILKLSLYCAVKNPKITIANICLSIIYGFLLMSLPSILPLFLISILCYGIMYLEKDIINGIESKLEPESTLSQE
jgi:uncharacterized membrane protein YesL